MLHHEISAPVLIADRHRDSRYRQSPHRRPQPPRRRWSRGRRWPGKHTGWSDHTSGHPVFASRLRRPSGRW